MNKVYIVLTVVLVAFLGGYAIAKALDTPQAFISWSSGDCIKAEGNKGNSLPCDEALKGKYNTIWVK